MVRVNQVVDVLVEVQVVEEVKATEGRTEARIAQEAKATGVHLHPVE